MTQAKDWANMRETIISLMAILAVISSLYRNIVMLPYMIIVLIIAGYSIIKKKPQIYILSVFCFFFPWLVSNEVKQIYDRQYSILLFAVISIFMAFDIYKSYPQTVSYFQNKRKRTSFIGDFIISVCAFGLPIIRFVQDVSLISGIALLVMAMIWSKYFSYVVYDVIYRNQHKNKTNLELKKENSNNQYLFFCMVFFVMILIGMLSSIFYYPGPITRDCASIYWAAQNLGDITLRTDIHSFGWTLVVAFIDSIFHNYYAVTIFLVIAFAFSWSFYMKTLYNCGVSKKIIIVLSLIWLCVPGDWYYIVCSWKDMPFAICMLLMSALICGIVFDRGEKIELGKCIGLGLASFGMAVFRSNGQVILAVLLISTIVLLSRRKAYAKRLAMCFGIAMIMLVIFKGPVFKMLKVSGTPEGLYTLPYIDGIWENVHLEVELSDNTINFIENEIMPLDDFKAAYQSGYTNRYAFPNGYEHISLQKAHQAYFECLKLHPFITISARLKRTYNLWGIMLDSEYPVDRNYVPVIPDLTAISEEYDWKYLSRYDIERTNIERITSASNAYGFITMTMSRCGLCIVIWVLISRFSRLPKDKLILLLTPLIINTIVLVVGCCFPDYRYVYPMFLLTLPLMGVSYIPDMKGKAIS